MSENRVVISSGMHLSLMMIVLKHSRQEGHLTDVTIFGNNGNVGVKAHKIVLSGSSPYFYGLFQSLPAAQPVVVIPDTDVIDIERVIEYIYSGVVILDVAQLPSFIKLAEKLEIIGLKDLTEGTNIVHFANPCPSAQPEHIANNIKTDSDNPGA